jgi:tRNA-specific adenosine deaminase 2
MNSTSADAHLLTAASSLAVTASPPAVWSTPAEEHHYYMSLALSEASSALLSEEVAVGCVIVHRPSRRVLGRGRNATNVTKNGTRHCEFLAMEEIAQSEDPEVRDVDLGSQC